MNDPILEEAIGELLVFGSVGLVALIVLAAAAARGALSLRSAPRRDVMLTPMDLIVAFALFIVGSFAAQLTVKQLGYDPGNLPENVRAMMGLVQQLLMHGPAVLYVIARLATQQRGLSEWGLLPHHPAREAVAGGVGFLIGLPLVLGLNIAMVVVGLSIGLEKPDTGHEMLKLLRDSQSSTAVALMTLSAVVVAPIVEEMLFRGLIQTVLLNTFGREQRWLVLIGASLLFAAVHLPITPWQTFPGLFLLGLMFGWLYERHGSLLPGCIMHCLFNAANVALVFVITDA